MCVCVRACISKNRIMEKQKQKRIATINKYILINYVFSNKQIEENKNQIL